MMQEIKNTEEHMSTKEELCVLHEKMEASPIELN